LAGEFDILTGFDEHGDRTTLLQEGWVLGSGASIAAGALGGSCLALAGGFGTAQKAMSSTASKGMGFRFKADAFGNGGDVLSLREGTTSHIVVNVDSLGRISIKRGATVIVGPSAALSAGAWYHWGVKSTIADAGGLAALYLNGVLLLNFSGDTRNAGALGRIDNLLFASAGSGGIGGVYIDDLYVLPLTGPAPYNDLIGTMPRVRTAMAVANGYLNQGTPTGVASNHDAVNDVPPNPTARKVSLSSGQRDSYSFSPGISGNPAIYGVKVNPNVSASDAGVITQKPFIRLGGTNYDGTAQAPSAGSNAYQGEIWAQNPATAAPFTQAELNSGLEAGVVAP
jgi:hypothetical protein